MHSERLLGEVDYAEKSTRKIKTNISAKSDESV